MRTGFAYMRDAAVTLGLVLCTASAASAGTLTPELEAIVAATPSTTRVPVLIMLNDQVNVEDVAGGIESREERLALVVEALKARALATQNTPGACGQPGLVSQLAAAGPAAATDIRQLWSANAVAVQATPSVIATTARRTDVREVAFAGTREVAVGTPATSGVQWNITRVRAPEAWALGHRGAGGIVASIDTGGNVAHPDLASGVLRAGQGNQMVWHDAVAGQSVPYDDDGHGSHLLGVAVGKNGIGVAPDAKWMACKAFVRQGEELVTTTTRILECAQWILNPLHPALTDPAAPDIATVPDAVLVDLVVSAAGYCDPLLQQTIRAWRAARILPVFSVGDDPAGPPIGAVPSPANDPLAFSVGGSDNVDQILPSAYRGITFCPGPEMGTAPRVIAPGLDVVSAWLGTGYRKLTGSEIGAAHVAGAMALIRGTRPETRRVSIDYVDHALTETAVPVAGGQRLLDVFSAVTLEDADCYRVDPNVEPMPAGGTWQIHVTCENTGLSRWTPERVKLRFAGASSPWGVDVVEMPPAIDEVLPGQAVEFVISMTAPGIPNETPGYPSQWQLFADAGPDIGLPTELVYVPVFGLDAAAYLDQSVSCAAPGAPATAVVTFRNTGSTTWTSSTHECAKLGTYGDPGSVSVPSPIAPNATFQCLMNFSGPFPSGVYYFQRQMRRGVTPIGEASPRVRIDTNTCVAESNQLLSMSGPGEAPAPVDELRAGQSGTVSVAFRNTGQSTWRPGYTLRALAGVFGGNVVPLGTTVDPGQTATFQVSVVAPNLPGRWDLRFQMYNDVGAGEAFGDEARTTIGIPRDHVSQLEFASLQGANNWFYRYYNGNAAAWSKLTWKADAAESGGGLWRRSDGANKVYQSRILPGNSSASGLFWKSPTAAWVRASISAQLVSPFCTGAEEVQVRLLHNNTLQRKFYLRGLPPPYLPQTFEAFVQPDDTIRFVVRPVKNNSCGGGVDAVVQVDALVQVLPPKHPNTGPVPGETHAVSNLALELGGE